MGTASIGTLAGLTLHAAKLGDQFDKMSLRTGIAVENLSALSYAAQISGSDVMALETGLRFLARRTDEAGQGIGIAKDAFEKLGISVKRADGQLKPTMSLLKEAAEQMSKMTNETEQVSAAMDIFGARSGPGLLPLLKQGQGGIEELMKRAEELGLVISTKSAKAAADFNDRMLELKTSLSMASMEIGMTLIPILKPLVEKFTEIIGKVKEWTSAHPKLTAEIGKFAAVLGPMMVVGGSLMILAPTIAKITIAVKALIPAVAGLSTAIYAAVPYLLLGAGALTAVAVAWREVSSEGKKWVEANKGLKSTIKTEADLIKALGDRLDEVNISMDALGYTFGDAGKQVEYLGTNVLGLYNTFGNLIALMGKRAEFAPLNLEEARKEMDQMVAGLGKIGRPAQLPPVLDTDLLRANKEREKAFEESWKATVDTVEGAYAFMKTLASNAARAAIDERKRQADEEIKTTYEMGKRIEERAVALQNREIERREQRVQAHKDAEKKILDASKAGFRKYLESQKEAFETAAKQVKEAHDRMIADIQAAFSTLIQDMVMNFDDLGDVLENFINNVMRSLLKELADMIAKNAFKGFNQPGLPEQPAAPEGGGFPWGQIGMQAAIALGKASVGAPPVPMGPGFAAGGITPPVPSLVRVGERGREAIVPLEGGRKIPVELKGRDRSLIVNIDRIEFPNSSLERMDEERLRKVVQQRVIPIIAEATREGIG
jgi:hypothetical protein